MSRSQPYAVILAGGRGTRFWPRSRTKRAKQVLEFLGMGTLIQQTVERLLPVFPPERIWVLTNEHLRKEISRQLPQVPARQILAEPAQRNTAPAIGLAAKILTDEDPNAVMAVFPADHYIAKRQAFLRLVRAAVRAASAGKMVLLGIQPRWPETGYGYLEFAPGTLVPGCLTPSAVVAFREKPKEEQARQYLAEGRYCWNAGMFFWRAQVLLDELQRHLPKTAGVLARLPKFGSRRFHAELSRLYPETENISVDYAVLERTSGVCGLAADDIGWNDVGSWNAIYELLPHDGEGNTGRSDAVTLDSHRNLVEVPGKVVALLGVEDLVIIDTPDALLVARRDRSQHVGEIVKLLERQKRAELL